MQTFELLGSALGVAFVAGIRLYATIFAIGLGLHLGLLHLPHHLEGLVVLGHPVVIGAAGVAYVVEFFADKIAWVDTLWDSFHLLIRPLGAVLLALAAVGNVEPVAQVVILLLCGGVALSTHSTKAGFRLLVNQSPEPFSNIGVSLAEDVFAFVMAWLALVHPLVALAAVAVALGGIALVTPMLFRLIRVEALAMGALARRWLGAGSARSAIELRARLPAELRERVRTHDRTGEPILARGVAGRGVGMARNSVGILLLAGDGLVFVAPARLRRREWRLPLDGLRGISLQPGFLVDRLTLENDTGSARVYLFKDDELGGHRLAGAARLLVTARAVGRSDR